MKTFKLTTQVPSTKTVEYVIEAENEKEALKILNSGTVCGEGEEVEDETFWEDEQFIDIEFIEEL